MFGFLTGASGGQDLLERLTLQLPLFIVSITLHEAAHAWAALRMGDDTSARLGRLTLNPLAHLDPLGTLMLLFAPVGWARPVPVDEGRLSRWGSTLVSAAGPLSNLLIAFLSLLGLKHLQLPTASTAEATGEVLKTLLLLNLNLAVFNLLPIPPFDGAGILRGLLPERLRPAMHQLVPYGVVALVLLVFLPQGQQLLGGLLRTALSWLVEVTP
ncbi:MAG: site-2 protease family protein [Candidatus Sericytochromatia bacterium]|nr:site-2 protease family protein [Candidatus Sericytochromatia bacterium]